jgi:uridine phosphorylase
MMHTQPVSQATHQPLPHQTTGDIKGTNFPMDGEGRVYHLALKKGELANDIIIVGDPNRAAIVSEFLTQVPSLSHVFPHTCNRGFTTYTGTFEGRLVSVMAIGMGFPMVNFFAYEGRAIVEGRMRIIRLGSCGTPQEDISIGTIVTAKYAFGIFADTRPYYERKVDGNKFTITKPVSPDPELHNALKKALSVAEGAPTIVDGGCAATDYFYSSQGRDVPAFPEDNQNLLTDVLEKYPDTGSIEMESYHLFDLAAWNTDAAKQGEGMSAAACNIVLAARKTGAFLSHEEKHRLESIAGKACLQAFIALK